MSDEKLLEFNIQDVPTMRKLADFFLLVKSDDPGYQAIAAFVVQFCSELATSIEEEFRNGTT